jgi:hypothetical protein
VSDVGGLTPQPGEALILLDGRRFTLSTVQAGVRGWWFTATAHDGSCTLQGNLRLTWDVQRQCWCTGEVLSAPAVPQSLRRKAQPRLKQTD